MTLVDHQQCDIISRRILMIWNDISGLILWKSNFMNLSWSVGKVRWIKLIHQQVTLTLDRFYESKLKRWWKWKISSIFRSWPIISSYINSWPWPRIDFVISRESQRCLKLTRQQFLPWFWIDFMRFIMYLVWEYAGFEIKFLLIGILNVSY